MPASSDEVQERVGEIDGPAQGRAGVAISAVDPGQRQHQAEPQREDRQRPEDAPVDRHVGPGEDQDQPDATPTTIRSR